MIPLCDRVSAVTIEMQLRLAELDVLFAEDLVRQATSDRGRERHELVLSARRAILDTLQRVKRELDDGK
jgi:hypothetical protein